MKRGKLFFVENVYGYMGGIVLCVGEGSQQVQRCIIYSRYIRHVDIK